MIQIHAQSWRDREQVGIPMARFSEGLRHADHRELRGLDKHRTWRRAKRPYPDMEHETGNGKAEFGNALER